MKFVPIEVVWIGDVPGDKARAALRLANSVQSEFHFEDLPPDLAKDLEMYAYKRVKASEMLDTLDRFRNGMCGYHPFLIAIVHSYLDGRQLSNLFGSRRAKKGVAVVTTANVPDLIIPKDKMEAYFLYYFARYALNFMAPAHKNHEDTRQCVFDRKVHKPDLLQSMGSRALCDNCRRSLVKELGSNFSSQLAALDKIFVLAGEILAQGVRTSKLPSAVGEFPAEASSHQTHPVPGGTRTLFLSHSSKDLATVEALVELIRSALMISPEQLRCTSLEGYRLPGGEDVDELLRQEVREAEAFIGLISYASVQSTYVLFELGARWGADKHFVPLLAPGVDSGILVAPLSAFNALSCTNAAQLHQLLNELARRLEVALAPPHTYQRYIDRVVSLPPSSGNVVIPKYLQKELEFDFGRRRDRLSEDQKQIIKWIEEQSVSLSSVPQKTLEDEFRHRLKSVYWRLEVLCYLGFLEKEKTDYRNTPRYNYRLSGDYSLWISQRNN